MLIVLGHKLDLRAAQRVHLVHGNFSTLFCRSAIYGSCARQGSNETNLQCALSHRGQGEAYYHHHCNYHSDQFLHCLFLLLNFLSFLPVREGGSLTGLVYYSHVRPPMQAFSAHFPVFVLFFSNPGQHSTIPAIHKGVVPLDPGLRGRG